MREVAMLQGADPKQILRTAVEKRVPAIMTYLSKGKWHVAKVFLTGLGLNELDIESAHFEKRLQPINIRVHQPVGISFKHRYGKFVFDTSVIGLKPSLAPGQGGTITLVLPDRIEVVQRRSYFRVSAPEFLKVNVLLWHRSRDEADDTIRDSTRLGEGASRSTAVALEGAGRCGRFETRDCFQGRLVDVSAGGTQVVIPHQSLVTAEPAVAGEMKPDFKKGQFVGVRFTPMPYETPLMFNAQIRNVLPAAPSGVGRRGGWPAADDEGIYIGLQIIGLEASPEGRKVLSRIVGVVERYFKIDQSSAKQQDMQSAPAAL
jgi:hypothetical protein